MLKQWAWQQDIYGASSSSSSSILRGLPWVESYFENSPNKWVLSVMENSSLGGISSGPATLISGPTHSFIQEGLRAPTQETGLEWWYRVVATLCSQPVTNKCDTWADFSQTWYKNGSSCVTLRPWWRVFSLTHVQDNGLLWLQEEGSKSGHSETTQGVKVQRA